MSLYAPNPSPFSGSPAGLAAMDERARDIFRRIVESYLETGDPKYTPIHKLEPLRRVYEQEYTLLGRLAKLLGLMPWNRAVKAALG